MVNRQEKCTEHSDLCSQKPWCYDKHIFNPGCIGKVVGKELRASYAIFEADKNGYSLTPHYVEYDTEAVIEQLYNLNFPTPEFMAQFYRGDYVPMREREERY